MRRPPRRQDHVEPVAAASRGGPMKTLLLLRHGKSSWDELGLDDHDRPLKTRGIHDAPRMGRVLVREGIVPDAIVSSTAVRARSTAEAAARACGFVDEVTLDRRLYLAGREEFEAVLRGLPPDLSRVMLVGHNPGLEGLVAALTGRAARMPTAALARIDLDLRTWRSFRCRSVGHLAGLWLPRQQTD